MHGFYASTNWTYRLEILVRDNILGGSIRSVLCLLHKIMCNL